MANRIVFTGLSGANPLAFLCALGTFRTLSHASEHTIRLGWQMRAGTWAPYLTRLEWTEEEIPEILHKHLETPTYIGLLRDIGDNLTISPQQFNSIANDLLTALETNGQRSEALEKLDILAAFGSDAGWQSHSKDRQLMQDTALRTMSGAGHQHFIKFIRDIIDATDVSHYESSLFEKWRYTDEGKGLNLRWDPADDRRHAMRWKNPSSDAIGAMRGANRLAIEALPLMPVAPTGKRVDTTGFRKSFWTWPIWEGELTLKVATAVLQMYSVVNDSDRSDEFLSRGIVTRYRSKRMTVGKFRNFSPAKTV